MTYLHTAPIPEADSAVLAAATAAAVQRVELDPDTVQHDLAKLVLSLVETIRQLIERQALRRVENGRLSDAQIERMGLTLMRLEERMTELKAQFGLSGQELRLDLGGVLDEL